MTLLTLPNLVAWSVQVALIVGAALLTLRMLRFDAPAVRYTLLRVVLAVCLLLPLLQPRQPLGRFGARASADPGDVRLASAADDNRVAPALASALAPLALALPLVVATGAALRLLWIGAGLVRLRRLRRAGEAAAGIGEHDELQALIGTRAGIRYVPRLGQPVTFGFRHPVVLLPDSLRQKAPAIQRAVIAHELWHVRRRDWMWTLAEEAVRAVLWFHPAIWILLSRIQSTREEAVDELTVLATGSRRSYMDALLAFADEPPIFAATAFARRRHLVHRMVLISKEAVMSGRHVAVCGAALALVVGASGWYGTQAFPLRQGADPSQILMDRAGPLERQAKAITPENPVPRRIAAAAAEYPVEAAQFGANGTVTVRATLDPLGHVAEARAVGVSLRLRNRGAVVHVSSARPETIERFLDASVLPSGNGTAEQQRESLRAMLGAVSRSATEAVSSWTYAKPADAPIAFFVNVPIGAAEAAAA
ncbi:MAG: M56 family metallopeptidase, partial [Acidobacteriota bacterium]